MSQENVELIRRMNAIFNAGDVEAAMALFHDDVEFVDHRALPDVEGTASGKRELVAVLEAWSRGFEDFRAEIEEYVDAGDHVVCRTRWRGTSREAGVELDQLVADAYEVRDGRVTWMGAAFRDVPEALEAVAKRGRAPRSDD